MRFKEIEFYNYKCVYCNKSPEESKRAVFMIRAPGTYYQCYPILCDEN